MRLGWRHPHLLFSVTRRRAVAGEPEARAHPKLRDIADILHPATIRARSGPAVSPCAMTESRIGPRRYLDEGVERRTRCLKGLDRDEREHDRCQPAGAEPTHERDRVSPKADTGKRDRDGDHPNDREAEHRVGDRRGIDTRGQDRTDE